MTHITPTYTKILKKKKIYNVWIEASTPHPVVNSINLYGKSGNLVYLS